MSFSARSKRSYVRAADVQRCLRAGGKHNDLENVGYTARHHTFFEMLGNWSFGDYFKRDAIRYAWELLTERLQAAGGEALGHGLSDRRRGLRRLGATTSACPRERIVRIGDNKGAPYASDNFWQMADTGPCGPCSEIFYDHGPEIAGGPPGSPDAEGDRYIEIWNLVFMQFDRDDEGHADAAAEAVRRYRHGTRAPCRRAAARAQQLRDRPLPDADPRRGGARPARRISTSPSLRVIADHIRACAFLIVDGVIPSNEGRGYVLRRIIRRAIRHGYQLGQKQPFFHKLVPELSRLMGDAYPELPLKQDYVDAASSRPEEERFAETLEHGMKVLEGALAEAKASRHARCSPAKRRSRSTTLSDFRST